MHWLDLCAITWGMQPCMNKCNFGMCAYHLASFWPSRRKLHLLVLQSSNHQSFCTSLLLTCTKSWIQNLDFYSITYRLHACIIYARLLLCFVCSMFSNLELIYFLWGLYIEFQRILFHILSKIVVRSLKCKFLPLWVSNHTIFPRCRIKKARFFVL